MKTRSPKRLWTRAEKSLLLAPLLIALASGAVWLWRERPPTLRFAADEQVTALEWSPDSRRLAVATLGTLSGSRYAEPSLFVFDARTGTKICALQPPPLTPTMRTGLMLSPSPWWPSWSPDGTRIASGYHVAKGAVGLKYNSPRPDYIEKIAVWNASNGTLQSDWLYGTPKGGNFGADVVFSLDGRQLIGSGSPPALFDARSGARVRRFGSQQTIKSRLNTTQTLAALYGENPLFEVRDLRTGRVLWKPAVDYLDFYSSFEWGHGDVLGLAPRHKKEALLLWNGQTRRALPSPPLGSVSEFALSPASPLVALTNVDRTLITPTTSTLLVWNHRLNRPLWTRPMQQDFHSLAWSPDGKWLSLVERTPADDTLQVFDAHGNLRLKRPFRSVGLSRWSPDSKQIAVVFWKKNDAEITFVRLD